MGRFAWVFCWLVVACAALPGRVVAATVDWLYDVDVPVTDQSVDVRNAAFRQALLIVIKRMTGLADVPSNGEIAAALQSPQRYYSQYRYRTDDSPRAADATVSKPLLLSVRFAESAVRKLVLDAGLPQWSANRPTTIAWVVLNDGTERTVLGASDPNALVTSMIARAKERGLPLVLPMMDLDEQTEVQPNDVWSGNADVVVQASERYNADQVLVGRVTHTTPDAWNADWQLTARALGEHGSEQRFAIQSATPEAAGTAIVDRIVELLVVRYVAPTGSEERMDLRIDGISSVADYGALLRYLSGLDFISGVRVEQVRAEAVLLSISTRAPWDRMRDLLALDGRLEPAEQIEIGGERRVLTWHGNPRGAADR